MPAYYVYLAIGGLGIIPALISLMIHARLSEKINVSIVTTERMVSPNNWHVTEERITDETEDSKRLRNIANRVTIAGVLWAAAWFVVAGIYIHS